MRLSLPPVQIENQMNHKIGIPFLFLVSALLIFLFPRICNAGNMGSHFVPMPQQGGFALSANVSSVKRPAIEYDDQYISGSKPDINMEADTKFLQGSYGVTDHLAVDLLLGTVSGGESEGNSFGDANAWGLGLRMEVWRFEEINLGINTSFQYVKSSEVSASGESEDSGRWEDWHLAVDAAWPWKQALFYGGLGYSDLINVYTHAATYGTREGGFRGENNVGMFLGASFDVWQNIYASIECRFIAETSAAIGISYEF